MGVVANFPLALATGLGLNAFVTFSVASQMTWADAMGLVVIEGVIILVLVLTGFREAVFRAVPSQLKVAISVGIGLFLTIIGLVDAGFVRRTGVGPVPVELGPRRPAPGLAGRRVRARADPGVRAARAEGARRDPDLDRRDHRRRDHRRGGRRDRAHVHRCRGQRHRLEPHRAGLARRHRRQARPPAARRVQPARVLGPRGRRDRGAAGLHPAARRLLRHDGHDDGDRRRGRACSTTRACRRTPSGS